jgi:hypothetical protein
MKKLLILLCMVTVGCQTAKIKNTIYKYADATTELGSIGEAASTFNLKNDFVVHSFPTLQNKIRLDVQVLPLTKNLSEIYLDKVKVNPSAIKVNYVDTLAVKPEYVTLTISDINGFATELNADYNKNSFQYLKDTETPVLVTGIAVILPAEDIAKIRMSDAFYLHNNQEKKYTIALYKTGKKTENIDLNSMMVLAYTIGKFCWSVNDRQHWYIGDIVKDNKSCKGNTISKIKKREEKNLYKL